VVARDSWGIHIIVMRTRRLNSSSDPVPPSKVAHRATLLDTEATRHIPVLLHETIRELAIARGDIVVDTTLGGAGHASAIAERLGAKGLLIGIDADHAAIERSRNALAHFNNTKIHLIEGNFRNLAAILNTLDVPTIDKALFDLGWSGYQLAAGKGFSFLRDEPLLMTYGEPGEGTLTARTIVNEWSEDSIADVLFGWGEERYARRIAKKIVERRTREPIETSMQLAAIVKEAVPPKYRFGRIHPATKTFQALRIAVNDELGALSKGLSAAWEHLREDGRIAVITFHSIEDREVKHLFAGWEKSGSGKRVAKKPIRPTREEIERNPRARSAKLRVVKKVLQEI